MENKGTRRNGYIYSKGTQQGFIRMQRQGIPKPLFSIEDRLYRILKGKYQQIVKKIISDFREKIKTSGITSAVLTIDADSDDAKRIQEEAEKKALLSTAAYNLESEWEEEPIPDLAFEHRLADIIMWNRENYAKRLYKDASPIMQIKIKNFSIDKNKLYERNLEEIEQLYLNNAMARIFGTENLLKHKFISKINDYVTGKTDKLEISTLVEELNNSAGHMARFFARDQLARLNKATTLATFKAAKVTKVKWVTTHDVRVRDTHKKLDGQIFDINYLPPEIDDFNCRCGLVPVEYSE